MSERYFFVLIAVLYGGFVAAGSWIVMRPDRKQLWRNRVDAGFEALWSQIDFLSRNILAGATQVFVRLLSACRSGWRRVLRNKYGAALTLVLLALPPFVGFCLSSHTTLDGYIDTPEAADPVVAALLRGEHLVPPPPLPPEIFLTADLKSVRPEIASASREWMLLDSEFRQRLLAVYRMMADHGYQMALIEGYRSPERQAHLAQLGPQVTHVGAYQSFHQYGLAADSAFFREGKILISEKDPWAMEGYRLYGKYAESVGLVWGGRWQMMDFGHVELRKAGILGHR